MRLPSTLFQALGFAALLLTELAVVVLFGGSMLPYEIQIWLFIGLVATVVATVAAMLLVGDRGYPPLERTSGQAWGDQKNPTTRVRVMSKSNVADPNQPAPRQLPAATSTTRRLQGPKR